MEFKIYRISYDLVYTGVSPRRRFFCGFSCGSLFPHTAYCLIRLFEFGHTSLFSHSSCVFARLWVSSFLCVSQYFYPSQGVAFPYDLAFRLTSVFPYDLAFRLTSVILRVFVFRHTALFTPGSAFRLTLLFLYTSVFPLSDSMRTAMEMTHCQQNPMKKKTYKNKHMRTKSHTENEMEMASFDRITSLSHVSVSLIGRQI